MFLLKRKIKQIVIQWGLLLTPTFQKFMKKQTKSNSFDIFEASLGSSVDEENCIDYELCTCLHYQKTCEPSKLKKSSRGH